MRKVGRLFALIARLFQRKAEPPAAVFAGQGHHLTAILRALTDGVPVELLYREQTNLVCHVVWLQGDRLRQDSAEGWGMNVTFQTLAGMLNEHLREDLTHPFGADRGNFASDAYQRLIVAEYRGGVRASLAHAIVLVEPLEQVFDMTLVL